MDVRERLTKSLPLIQQAIRFTCRRNHLDQAEHDDFAAVVMLKLLENDCAIIRKFEERSSFATFIATVIHRILLDYRIHNWGKWHASAEARRLGDAAVLLERLLFRDGCSLGEAVSVVARLHPDVTTTSIDSIVAVLPRRAPRPRTVELGDEADRAVTASDTTEHVARQNEHRRTASHVSQVMRAAIDQLSEEDRLILRLRFECNMNISQIAHSLHLPEKRLSRRIQKQLQKLRAELELNGVAASEVLEIIGGPSNFFEFPLSGAESRPSIQGEAPEQGEEVSR